MIQYHRTVNDYDRGLDRLFSRPVPLFIATMLAGGKWFPYPVLCEALGIRPQALSSQVCKLRDLGYVVIRRKKQTVEVRITRLGCDRLTAHLLKLEEVVTQAREFIDELGSGEDTAGESNGDAVAEQEGSDG